MQILDWIKCSDRLPDYNKNIQVRFVGIVDEYIREGYRHRSFDSDIIIYNAPEYSKDAVVCLSFTFVREWAEKV